MLRCLNALNPAFWCFTGADFEDLLLQIDMEMKRLNGVEIAAVNHHLADEKTVQALEKAYSCALHCLASLGQGKPDRQLTFLFGEILGKYGQICWKENAQDSRQILLASLNMHLYALGITNEWLPLYGYPSLAHLKKRSEAKESLLASSEEILLKMSPENFSSQAYSNTFATSCPDRRLLSIAKTIRWLGHTYQKMESKRTDDSANDQLSTQLFNFAEALFLLVNNEGGLKQLEELHAFKAQQLTTQYVL